MPSSSRKKGGTCPICRETPTPRFRPFCSKRCADLDLARWLNGNYAVPVVELDEKDLDELEKFVEGVDDVAPDESDESSGYG